MKSINNTVFVFETPSSAKRVTKPMHKKMMIATAIDANSCKDS
jgi:hypothetical protein